MNFLPPQAIDVEEEVLSRLIFGDVDEIDRCRGSYFYKTAHRTIFNAINNLASQKKTIDLVTVTNHLRDQGKLEEVGGASYLARLLNDVPLAVGFVEKCAILREKAIRRDLIRIGQQIIESAAGTGIESHEILDRFQSEILRIGSESVDCEAIALSELSDEQIDRYERQQQLAADSFTGLPTGFTALDKILSGLQDSYLIIIAARPSMGKTAIALNIQANLVREKIPALMFSLEMSRDQVFDRLVSAEAGINGMKFRRRFGKDDWVSIVETLDRFGSWPLYLDDSSSLSYLEICRRSRRAKRKHGIRAVFIDYLQYLRGDRGQGRNYEIESITRGLKALAKDLKLPVVLLSQLNRKCEERPNPYKRPQLSDLRDSGAIEQDADLILFLYRPEQYGEKDAQGNEQPGIAEINVAKHRNGPRGTIRLFWNDRFTRFENPEQGPPKQQAF